MIPVRFHHLKAVARSPLHLRSCLDGEEKASTSALEKGTAVHALLFGTKTVTFYPGAVRRGKEWDGFKAAHEGDCILTATEYEKAMRMAERVSNHKDAMWALDGVREKTILWKYLGRECRSTPDVFSPEMGFVTELKTCANADPQRFTWQALRMAYHAQLAYYMEAVAQSGLGTPRSAYVVAVESTAPYPVTVLRLTDRALDAGQRMFRLWFERFLACEQANAWPAYVESIVDLDVPEDDLELTFGDDDAAEAA